MKARILLYSSVLLAVMFLLIVLAENSHALSISLQRSSRGIIANSYAKAGSDYHFDLAEDSTTSTGTFNSTAESTASASDYAGAMFVYFPISATASATASQNTNLTLAAGLLEVSGNLKVSSSTSIGLFGGGPASTEVESYIDLSFSIDSPALYTFSLVNRVGFFTQNCCGYVIMENYGTSDYLLYGNEYPFSGIMSAGDYRFHYWVDNSNGVYPNIDPLNHSNNAYSNIDFSFVVSEAPQAPVPEPATMLFLGAGLIMLATFWRKKLR